MYATVDRVADGGSADRAPSPAECFSGTRLGGGAGEAGAEGRGPGDEARPARWLRGECVALAAIAALPSPFEPTAIGGLA